MCVQRIRLALQLQLQWGRAPWRAAVTGGGRRQMKTAKGI
jgi:hypothetical protein